MLKSNALSGDDGLRAVLEKMDEDVLDYCCNPKAYGFWHRLWAKIFRHNEQCCMSWMLVTLALEQFLQDPAKNYTAFVKLLETERQKFPHHRYAEHLNALIHLIQQGPQFSQDQPHLSIQKLKFSQSYTYNLFK